MKALFVPFTETQMAEFRGLVDAGFLDAPGYWREVPKARRVG